MANRLEIVENLEKFLDNNNLQDSDDIDALLELASLVRELVDVGAYENICKVINYTVANEYYEAFSWCMEILQEVFEKDDCCLEHFECDLGKSIPSYDEFIERLEVDFNVLDNGYDTVCDNHGEVESFFNNLLYKTKYEYIYLVSSENFDTKDNDYIQYRLVFGFKERNK